MSRRPQAGLSTTYQYPLFESEVFEQAGQPAIRCKLDGTAYDLVRARPRACPPRARQPMTRAGRGLPPRQATGRVLEWCPREDSPLSLRNVFATLKATTTPVPLIIYPTRVTKTGKVEILYK